MNAPGAVVVEGLTKSFRVVRPRPGRLGRLRSLVAPLTEARTVVQDLSFTVGRGELVGLLGPNGAGKSTTIKMLTGILVPTAGTVTVNGLVPHRERELNARRIGAIFGQRTQLWWDLPARDSLLILRDMYGIDPATYRRRLAEFDEILELSRFWLTPVRQLSLGQRVRCDLAASLLHDPDVVFLDEPTIGMDVVVKRLVREFLDHQVRQRGRTVVLTTHDMTEISLLCERLLLINGGRLVFDGTTDALRRRYASGWTVRVRFTGPVDDQPWIPGAELLTRSDLEAVFAPVGTVARHDVIAAIVSRYRIAAIAVEEPGLEDVLRAVYTSPVEAAGAVA